ncbi:MAG: gag-pol poly [Lasallia pustulata]|uniref:Gag-pol poly n=1 Tax=Lasallia pustulata TaxID=136370 RepID=A0A5M8PLY4_9LECA|nr:MAG: gag-pol poly [Lasallia pustulata]
MDGGTTGIPAVHNLPAQEASRDGDAVVRQDSVVPDINIDIGRPGYPEAQHRLIEDSTADAEAMDIDDTIDNDPIGLQIEAGASDKTVKALWLVAAHTPIGGKATAYIKTANAVLGTANMATNMAATMASIWSQWQEIDDVIYYDSKIYVPQNTALRNVVISRYHDDIFASHFGKSRTAELMRQTHDWPGAVRDVRCYCHDCVKCQKAKPAHHKPFGLAVDPIAHPTQAMAYGNHGFHYGPALEQHLWKYDMYSVYNKYDKTYDKVATVDDQALNPKRGGKGGTDRYRKDTLS